ncbi:hypothetical protein E2562_015450 [Oryza meyeriana var. granulata]|uniref:Uncharacterized protein n=1 Tax=Oryza meyeriana var. granulata TaxID=110450 RepID=A0A6G1BVI5_9ORYZ|nr:hypothetical protein E2562_015450 [Oryza meyeriana var. granulata]
MPSGLKAAGGQGTAERNCAAAARRSLGFFGEIRRASGILAGAVLVGAFPWKGRRFPLTCLARSGAEARRIWWPPLRRGETATATGLPRVTIKLAEARSTGGGWEDAGTEACHRVAGSGRTAIRRCDHAWAKHGVATGGRAHACMQNIT